MFVKVTKLKFFIQTQSSVQFSEKIKTCVEQVSEELKMSIAKANERTFDI